MESLAGRQIGKYNLIEEIGRGGMAIVYHGYDTVLQRPVAVKVLALHLTWEPEFVERFLREARAAARLTHPNIVTIHDVGQQAGLYYLVMEYLDGVNLKQYLREHRPLPISEVLSILRQLAAALDQAHEAGVVHRDVKASNVILDRKGRVILTDFGIARAAFESKLTATGAALGTPEYMAPEQASGKQTGPWTDIYALGVIAYELLSGQTPFEADTTPAILYKVVHETPPPILSQRQDLPEAIEPVLERALNKDPRLRYPSGAALVEALEQALSGQAVKEAPAVLFPAAPPPGGAKLSPMQLPFLQEQAPPPAAKPSPRQAPPMQPPLPPAPKPQAAEAATRRAPTAQPAAPTRRLPPWIWAIVALGGIGLLAIAIGVISSNSQPTPAPYGPVSTQPPIAEPTPRPTATTAPLPTAIPTATPVPEPVVLHLNLGYEPSTLDPALATDISSVDAAEQLFLGLTAFEPETSEVLPELATAWDISADGTVYTFHLRDDVYWIRYDPATDTFETIRPVSADDVEYGIRRALMPETNSNYAYILYIIHNAYDVNQGDVSVNSLGVRALDDYTIEFELEEPAGYFPAIVAMWVAQPVPKEAIEQYGTAWVEPGNIMTNAAYALKTWAHDNYMTLIKNPFYYRADQVQIDVVEFMITEAATALAMYENGELDSASVPLSDLDRVRADPLLSQEMHTAPVACTYYYGFTTTKPPFDNASVRRAFSYAIDRQGLIDNVLKGGQLPANSFAPPDTFGHAAFDRYIGVYYDPDRARDELAAAGYPGGAGFPTVTLMHNTSEGHARIAQAIQQMWQDTLGVTVNVEDQEWAVYLQAIGSTTPAADMPHIWRLGWCSNYPDQNDWIHENFNPDTGANRPHLSRGDWQVGSAVAEFAELTELAGVETDPEQRAEMYRQAEHLLVHDIAAIAPLYYYTSIYVSKPYLSRNYPVLAGMDIENWRIVPP